jgi:putative hemolysin
MLAFAIVVVLLLVVLNGLFAMTELAVVSSRKSKLHSRAERGDRGARRALNWPRSRPTSCRRFRSASP